MSILNKNISKFKNATSTKPEDINLLEWLTGHKPDWKFLIYKLRLTNNKPERDQLKKQLPCITPSGVFTVRNKSGLIQHSGLIAFDIDNIGDSAHDIKEALKRIPNIAYCGLSASGAGLWGLIPISDGTKHKAHFRAIELAFVAMGITIDPSCKDVSRLRFYSYDDQAYINHNAVIFDQVYYDPPPATVVFTGSSDRVIDRACKLISTAPDGQKYFNLNKAAFLLGGYIGAGKIDEQDARQSLRNTISSREVVDLEAAFRTIDIGLKQGMLKPVTL